MYCDDSDMKIMPNSPSKLFDSAEGAAIAFLRETQNGNMEKARKLGKRLAGELIVGDKGIPAFGVGAFDDTFTLLHRKVMFAYVVNQVLEDIAPTSIVAQSGLSAFYDTVRKEALEVYVRITDTAIFSMYTFSVRSTPHDPDAVGKVFARLCRRENDPVFVRYGCEISRYFTQYCTELALSIDLVR